MKKAMFMAVTMLALFTLAFQPPPLTPVPALAQNDDQAPYPVFAVGDAWEFKNSGSRYTEKVVAVTDDLNSIASSQYPNAVLVRNQHLTIQRVEGTFTFNPNMIVGWKFLDFPMAPGKKFAYDVQGMTAPFSIDVKAVKWESVKVPAGTFKALKIESCWHNRNTNWRDCGMTHWYSPDAKHFIKRRTPMSWAPALLASDYELVKYIPAQ
jgi:hypothetical protein